MMRNRFKTGKIRKERTKEDRKIKYRDKERDKGRLLQIRERDEDFKIVKINY